MQSTDEPFREESFDDPKDLLRYVAAALDRQGYVDDETIAKLREAVDKLRAGPKAAQLVKDLDNSKDPAAIGDSILSIAKNRKPLTTYDELDPNPGDPKWLIPGLILEASVCYLSGTANLGKTNLMCQIAAALASGEPEWASFTPHNFLAPERERKIVFASYEDKRDAFSRNFRNNTLPAIQRGKWRGNIKFVTLQGEGFLFGPVLGKHVQTVSETLATGHKLRKVCEDFKADLLIVDPIGAAFGSDENVRGFVRAFLDEWNHWAERANCAVMFVAHPSQSNKYWSGHTEWRNSVRTLLSLGYHQLHGEQQKKGKDDPEAKLGLYVQKQNYGRREKIWLRRRIQDRGITWEASPFEAAETENEQR